MARSFMILFVISVGTWLNENSFLILKFFLYCFYTSVKGNFFNSGVIVSFSDDIEIPSGQLKRFSEPVIDPNFY